MMFGEQQPIQTQRLRLHRVLDMALERGLGQLGVVLVRRPRAPILHAVGAQELDDFRLFIQRRHPPPAIGPVPEVIDVSLMGIRLLVLGRGNIAPPLRRRTGIDRDPDGIQNR